jgi:serine/threonine protein kinase
MKKMTGTAMYMAPEVMSQQGKYNEKADLWSVGVVAYSMLVSKFPFDNNDQV